MENQSEIPEEILENSDNVVMSLWDMLFEQEDEKKTFSLSELLERMKRSENQYHIIDNDMEKIKHFVYDNPPIFEAATLDFIKLLWSNVPIDIQQDTEIEEFLTKKFIPEKTTDNVKTVLKKNTETKPEKIEIPHGKVMCMSADPQTGKSRATIATSLNTMRNGRIPILVTRNRYGDANQFNSNFVNYNKLFVEYLERNNVDIKFGIECIEVCKSKIVTNQRKIQDAFNGGKPVVLMSLGNNTQLSRVCEIIQGNEFKYELLVDEVDYVDCGDSLTSKKLQMIKDNAYIVYGVTATPIEFMMSEKDMTIKNHVKVSPPEDYRGFHDIEYRNIMGKARSYGTKIQNIEQMFDADENIKYFIDEYLLTLRIYPTIFPTICLIKNTKILSNQNLLYKYICSNHLSKYVAITYNGDGTKINFNGMSKTGIKIAGQTVYPNKEVKIDIPDILQYFKDNGGVTRFPTIIILAGELAGRCISYVSRDYIWHLTDMYYIPSTSVTMPILLQAIGRLCGRNKGKSGLRLYAPKKILEYILGGLSLYREMVDRVDSDIVVETLGHDAKMSQALENIPVKKYKVSKFKLTTKVKPPKINTVENHEDDHGWSEDKYKYKIVNLYLTSKKQSESETEDNNDDGAEVIGNIVPIPQRGIKLQNYFQVCDYIKDKGWVRQADIRANSGVSDTRKMNQLRGDKDTVIGTSGLLWKQIGREYMYYYK
jgi:hypothetical protein